MSHQLKIRHVESEWEKNYFTLINHNLDNNKKILKISSINTFISKILRMIIMARTHARSKRKYTSKKYKHFRKKRKRELSRPTINPVIGPEKRKKQRTLGGNFKLRLFSTQEINVTDISTNKTSRLRILGFESNAASKDLNRRHVLTKGAIVETELGNVIVTSRPGQHGILNGVLLG
ncbi:MAG: 30S ribosomal protein S8e [Candidatus Lokiarchaeum sp. GC14_75]|nr:MAG: 30S ribosomal protein S8e [Candidatus Lokiarchaeum sp. GC14_75]